MEVLFILVTKRVYHKMTWLTDINLELFTAKSQSSNSRDDNVIQKREACLSLYRSQSHPRPIIIPYLWAFSSARVFAIQYIEIPKSGFMSCKYVRQRAISLWLYDKIKDCLYMKDCFFLWRSQYISCNNKMTSSSKSTVIISSNSNPNANRSNRFVSEWKKLFAFALPAE